MIQNETNERPATTGIVHGQVYVKGTNYEWVDGWDSREMMRRVFVTYVCTLTCENKKILTSSYLRVGGGYIYIEACKIYKHLCL